jgi:hypothetical protein
MIPGGLQDGANSFLSPLRLPVPPSRLETSTQEKTSLIDGFSLCNRRMRHGDLSKKLLNNQQLPIRTTYPLSRSAKSSNLNRRFGVKTLHV